jgi:hypothetical protein
MIKNFMLVVSLMIGSALLTSGQVTPITPAVPDNASPSDTNVKMRSAELERIKRDADKPSATTAPAMNSKIETKFPEIKEDFEGIQISQTAIIKTYTTDKKIDYSMIEISADNINKHAKRLDANLFDETIKKKESAKDEKDKAGTEKPKSLRDLIVELDNAIGSFVSSKIFANLKVVDSEVALKTRNDLTLIQDLSEKLSAEAKKLK